MVQIASDGQPDGAAQGARGGQTEFDLLRQWAAFRKYTRSFVITAVAVFIAVMAVTFILPKMYTATARVVLDPRLQAAVDNTGAAPQPKAATDTAQVDSEVEGLRSRALADRVIDQLHLDRDREFAAPPEGGLITRTLHLPPPTAQEARVAVSDNVMQRLKVLRTGTTYVIDVSFTSTDPEKAALIAQTFAQTYVAQSAEVKHDATGTASDVLSAQLAQLRDRAQKADAAVQQYRIQHGLLSAEGSSLTEQEIARLNLDLASAKADEAETMARYNTAREQMSKGAGDDVGEALSSPVVSQLRAQRATVSRELADLQSRYGPRYPQVLATQQQLTDLDVQIRTEIARVMSNLKAQVDIARQKTQAASGNLAGSTSKLAANSNAAVELNSLELDADAARQLYESFLNRYKQTAQSTSIQQSDARILAAATAPDKPSFPNKLLFGALGFILAIAAGVSMVVLRHMLEAGLSTAEQVEQKLGLRFLGSVPLLDRASSQRKVIGRFVVDNPLSAYADSLRNVRASIVFSRQGSEVRTMAFTSALPGEGKTTTTLSMARSAAMSGQSTVLIDCDVRRASTARALDLQVEKGLVEYLRGEATLDEVLVKDDLTPCTFLPIAKSRGDADDMVSAPAMVRLLEELKRRFHFVLLDTGPVLAVSDTRVLATAVDATVVIAQWRKTPRKATEAAIRMLEDVDAYIAGVVLTQVDLKEQAKSGYGDATYFYEQYRQYYTQDK